jgi:hypothetical protein
MLLNGGPYVEAISLDSANIKDNLRNIPSLESYDSTLKLCYGLHCSIVKM